MKVTLIGSCMSFYQQGYTYLTVLVLFITFSEGELFKLTTRPCTHTHIFMTLHDLSLLFSWHEGGKNDLFGKQDKEIMPWKCVDIKLLSSMGLTSAVRKVMSYSCNSNVP